MPATNENPAAASGPQAGLIGNAFDVDDLTFPLPGPQDSWPARQASVAGLQESVTGPRPCLEAAESFLRGQVRDAIHLVSIEPDGPSLDGRYFGEDAAGAAEWAIAENSRRRNVYWTVNAIRPGCDKKPKKGDIVAARFAHVDIDPPKNGGEFDRWDKRLRLDLLACPPSLLIDSGNGLQALWRLDRAMPDWQMIEDVNRGAESMLGADHCHNIDRLLRIPGTVNYPNEKKRAAGRAPVLATLADASEAAYAAEALTKTFPPKRSDKKDAERVRLGPVDLLTADDLGLTDRELIRAAIENPKGEDRSADGYRCACLMLHAGATPEQVAGILLNPENAVSGHYLDQVDPDRAVRRVIERARAEVKMEFPPIEDMPDVGAMAPADAPARSRLFYVRYGAIKPVLNQRYLLRPILMSGSMIVLYGDSNVGKSFLAVDWGFHIGTGRAWRGFKVDRGLVVYVAAEGGELVNNRFVALQKRYPDVDAFMALVPCPVDLLRPSGDLRSLIELVKRAEAEHGEKCVLIVIDTLSRALNGGDENGPEDMGGFVGNMDRLRAATKTAVLVVHHKGKDAAKKARGHTSLRAATDTEIEVTPDKRVVVTKQRDARAVDPFRFELATVIVGLDGEGEFVDSCVVEYPAADAPPSVDNLAEIERALSPDDAKLLAIVRGFEEGASLDTITSVAVKAGWTSATGKDAKDMVRRVLRRLESGHLTACTGTRAKARWAAAHLAEHKETVQ